MSTSKAKLVQQKLHPNNVSVIIPSYNSEMTLKNAILSTANSHYKLLEIIVIDDGSESLGSKFIVDSLCDIINVPLIYKKKDNGGPSSARNAGISIAKGDWIAFLDSDDIMLPQSIKSKFKHFNGCKDKKNIGGIYGSFIWSSTNEIQPFLNSFEPISRNYIGILGKVPGGAPAYLFQKEALEKVNGFDESLIFNEDFDLLLRLIKSGYNFVGTKEPGFIRNISENSLTRKSAKSSLVGSRIFLKKAYDEKLLSNHEIVKRLMVNYALSIKQFFISIIQKI